MLILTIILLYSTSILSHSVFHLLTGTRTVGPDIRGGWSYGCSGLRFCSTTPKEELYCSQTDRKVGYQEICHCNL